MWLSTYNTLFTNQCERCRRLLVLDSQTYRWLPPVQRHIGTDGRTYRAMHATCHMSS